MYIFPGLIWICPEIAWQLLLYRYHTLIQARERVLDHPSGALYAIPLENHQRKGCLHLFSSGNGIVSHQRRHRFCRLAMR